MKFIAKIIIIVLTLLAFSIVIGYIFNRSIIFPFILTDNLHIPEYRLHAVRLGAASTFAYFGIRYIFFQSTKLYPIQFLGVFLFFLSTIGSTAYYKHNVNLSDYYIPVLFFIISIIFYQAGKPKFRSYFKRK